MHRPVSDVHREKAGVARAVFLNLSGAIALKHHIDAAQGYLELGMTTEALAELDRVPAHDAMRADVMQLRAYVLMRARRWQEALDACSELRRHHPDEPLGFIHAAFCLHELGRTEEAMGVLLGGPASLLQEPVYFYNLGCYHAVLGRPDEAENYLRMSFNMDDKFREIARYDPDLASVVARL